jgi:hypothetical protein
MSASEVDTLGEATIKAATLLEASAVPSRRFASIMNKDLRYDDWLKEPVNYLSGLVSKTRSRRDEEI